MAKRVSKVRKSAILEHLLDLERQIRTELARASRERKAAAQREGRSPGSRTRDASVAEDGDGPAVAELAQRYLH
jgi:ribosome assembly protein YihI (activator of Der GTPase)